MAAREKNESDADVRAALRRTCATTPAENDRRRSGGWVYNRQCDDNANPFVITHVTARSAFGSQCAAKAAGVQVPPSSSADDGQRIVIVDEYPDDNIEGCFGPPPGVVEIDEYGGDIDGCFDEPFRMNRSGIYVVAGWLVRMPVRRGHVAGRRVPRSRRPRSTGRRSPDRLSDDPEPPPVARRRR